MGVDPPAIGPVGPVGPELPPFPPVPVWGRPPLGVAVEAGDGASGPCAPVRGVAGSPRATIGRSAESPAQAASASALRLMNSGRILMGFPRERIAYYPLCLKPKLRCARLRDGTLSLLDVIGTWIVSLMNSRGNSVDLAFFFPEPLKTWTFEACKDCLTDQSSVHDARMRSREVLCPDRCWRSQFAIV